MSSPSVVWVNGKRYNSAYLVDVTGRRLLARRRTRGRVGRTGGIGRRCDGVFVALFVLPTTKELTLLVGTDLQVLGEDVVAEHWTEGPHAHLRVSRKNGRDLRASERASLLTRLDAVIDPAHDEAGPYDDFLGGLARIINEPERQEWFVSHKDPDDGPWDVAPRFLRTRGSRSAER